MVEIVQFLCRSDNYGIIIFDKGSGKCISIDAPEYAKIQDILVQKGWGLTDILVTHSHYDHVEGIIPLKEQFGCRVTGPEKEAAKIPGIDAQVSGGDRISIGHETIEVIATPGHTLGMVNYYFPNQGWLFGGDTLFSLGCGRLFEGDGPMMLESLNKLKTLPPQTQLYCGHEYTLSNAKFALMVEPNNMALQKRAQEVEALCSEGLPTLPTSMAQELATNPFLRVNSSEIRRTLDMDNASDAQVFTELRKRKDSF